MKIPKYISSETLKNTVDFVKVFFYVGPSLICHYMTGHSLFFTWKINNK